MASLRPLIYALTGPVVPVAVGNNWTISSQIGESPESAGGSENGSVSNLHVLSVPDRPAPLLEVPPDDGLRRIQRYAAFNLSVPGVVTQSMQVAWLGSLCVANAVRRQVRTGLHTEDSRLART